MARKVFYSFHYKNDCWRTQQVRNIGAIEGNKPVSANDWEEVKKKGDEAIKKWINSQIDGKSCTIVLIGSDTASRKWVKYEISRSWDEGKGVLGIRIHNLKDQNSETSTRGENPFSKIKMSNGKYMDSYVKTYMPKADDTYNDIKNNIATWVEEAIEARKG